MSEVMPPISAFFTVYRIYAWRREKPMWFWSGSTVRESEISDIPAYNKANGIMWIVYSLVFWAGSVLGLFEIDIAGIPVLVLVYRKIYVRYKV